MFRQANAKAKEVNITIAKDDTPEEKETIKQEIKKTSLTDETIKNEESARVFKTKDYSIFASYPKKDIRLELHQGIEKEQLLNSIKAHGITTPIKVVPSKEHSDLYSGKCEFVVLGGHNRLSIAEELGIEVPYIIMHDLSNDVCDEIVAEEHLLNRQQKDFKPSTMMKLLQTIKKTSVNQKELIEKASIGKTEIYKYLSLTGLEEELLYDYIDTGKLALISGQQLAKESNENQKVFLNYIQKNPSLTLFKKDIETLCSDPNKSWNDEMLNQIFKKDKLLRKQTRPVTISYEKLDMYLKDEEIENAEKIIIRLLEEYKNGKIII